MVGLERMLAAVRAELERIMPPENTLPKLSAEGQAEPLQSPDSLFAETVRLYAVRFASELAAEAVPPESELTAWAGEIGDRFARRTEWVVHIDAGIEEPDQPSFDITILDRDSLAEVARYRQSSRSQADAPPPRLARRVLDAGDKQLWKLSAFVRPSLVIDTNRTKRGPFDFPRFIGPGIAFSAEIEWLRLVPTDEQTLSREREEREAEELRRTHQKADSDG
ncbi:MAG: hypothetical protein AAF235_11795 [Planctomycetota bacterium]